MLIVFILFDLGCWYYYKCVTEIIRPIPKYGSGWNILPVSFWLQCSSSSFHFTKAYSLVSSIVAPLILPRRTLFTLDKNRDWFGDSTCPINNCSHPFIGISIIIIIIITIIDLVHDYLERDWKVIVCLCLFKNIVRVFEDIELEISYSMRLLLLACCWRTWVFLFKMCVSPTFLFRS
jgi:hypothetical protein